MAKAAAAGVISGCRMWKETVHDDGKNLSMFVGLVGVERRVRRFFGNFRGIKFANHVTVRVNSHAAVGLCFVRVMT
jgi:hypothetical protein